MPDVWDVDQIIDKAKQALSYQDWVRKHGTIAHRIVVVPAIEAMETGQEVYEVGWDTCAILEAAAELIRMDRWDVTVTPGLERYPDQPGRPSHHAKHSIITVKQRTSAE